MILYTLPCSMSTLFPRFGGIILESGLFGYQRQQSCRGASRPVHPRLPLTDSLLPRTQLKGKFTLCHLEVSPQGLDFFSVPLQSAGIPFSVHAGMIHDLV